jgi:hypothetical protein
VQRKYNIGHAYSFKEGKQHVHKAQKEA